MSELAVAGVLELNVSISPQDPNINNPRSLGL